MSILTAIRREKKKVQKKLAELQHRLSGLDAAARALGDKANREVKKRVLSSAARAKISKAAKRRWAKIRAQAKKITG
jgi:predicted transcriptional regulator